ncbi:MAG TPA: hypothetical protein PK082_08605 [Phycisphaerae bacterium]|nr:hypothetical protein [Phycisphaerae bacterium]
MSLLWHLRAVQQSVEAGAAAGRAAGKALTAMEEAKRVDDRVEKLTLACMAMWELLRERTGLTEEDLLAKVREIDLRDGAEDGKVARQLKRCPRCDRVMSAKHARCLYCGEPDLQAGAFGQI